MEHIKQAVVCIGIATLCLLVLNIPAGAQVTLGQSCALTGPTSFLGTEMNRGAAAYFNKFAPNIKLKVLDDKYEPDISVKNTQQLLDEKVTALFGYVGTPTSAAALPYAMRNNTVFFGAFTGAGFLSDHVANPYSFSLRNSYDAEIENMLKRLKTDLNVNRIALFVQRDAFGLAGVTGTLKAVQKLGDIEVIPPIPPVPSETASPEVWNEFWRSVPNYPRNTIGVGQAVRQIRGNAMVGAVIMVGAYRPCAEAIRQLKRLDFDTMFLNISFVGAEQLAEYLRGDIKNVLVSQVVPDPWDPRIPLVSEYQAAITDKNFSFISLEGFLAAKVIHQAITNAGAKPDSTSLKNALENMNAYDAGGVKISFSPTSHRGMDSVFLTRIVSSPASPGGYSFNYINQIIKE